MKFDSDVAFVVVECLAKAKRPMNLQDILDEAPFERRDVGGIVHALYRCGFLDRVETGSGQEGDYLYSMVKVVTAYHIIKLGELGVDMATLSGWVKLSDKQKQAALSLAMQSEKLMQMDEELRAKQRQTSSKTASSRPLPRDAVVDTLERLALASELSIKEMKGRKAGDEVVAALKEAQREALKALANYQEQLQSGGADVVGY